MVDILEEVRALVEFGYLGVGVLEAVEAVEAVISENEYKEVN